MVTGLKIGTPMQRSLGFNVLKPPILIWIQTSTSGLNIPLYQVWVWCYEEQSEDNSISTPEDNRIPTPVSEYSPVSGVDVILWWHNQRITVYPPLRITEYPPLVWIFPCIGCGCDVMMVQSEDNSVTAAHYKLDDKHCHTVTSRHSSANTEIKM